MRIGLTYDLRSDYLAEGWDPLDVAEFDRDDTIDAFERAIHAMGHTSVRIGHARALMRALLAGERWDLVFNIAESLGRFGRESLVPALLEAYSIPCTFSDPLVCAVTLHKATAKRILRDAGLPTPAFLVIERIADVDRVDLPYPLFAKPVAEGSSKGVDRNAKARSAAELRAVCAELLERYRQPVLVETFLPGREVTVGLVGTGDLARVVGVLEVELLAHADAEIYTYANKEECETRVRYSLAGDAFADACGSLALAAWRTLGCRDGGRVDIRADAHGRPAVIEANPLPGLHPEHSDLPIMWSLAGRPYNQLIAEIVESALARTHS
ncbi:MAG: hypothetical protein U0575_04665 [Phycisphaerales bacterium]